ncbi:hypothetical protein SAMD00019534_125440 [Acytostelium subglobosum LB1]|uniref:hypothetical protein n=1 Tax=Acytostelium subglobosum LB1 TaxID=1410327 RepID=UPI000644B93B|nr:hypothetical protein SAMD00019534_125440 [Acytostelium subglobosum LB1]GAM29368.1 hypothetical protein SAMD00019534_125440 [Acytostelium subglobosum LB1]|eukprot:XP_012747673.1 hypothetical protein SAMD00019534_125440 [Acytostelium subglobosum LB1]
MLLVVVGRLAVGLLVVLVVVVLVVVVLVVVVLVVPAPWLVDLVDTSFTVDSPTVSMLVIDALPSISIGVLITDELVISLNALDMELCSLVAAAAALCCRCCLAIFFRHILHSTPLSVQRCLVCDE